jgi:hypothetical protein
MHLVQILLPLYDNSGEPFPQREYVQRTSLQKEFGGICTYVARRRLWRNPTMTVQDDIVI